MNFGFANVATSGRREPATAAETFRNCIVLPR